MAAPRAGVLPHVLRSLCRKGTNDQGRPKPHPETEPAHSHGTPKSHQTIGLAFWGSAFWDSAFGLAYSLTYSLANLLSRNDIRPEAVNGIELGRQIH